MGSTFRIRTSMARRDLRYLRLRLKKTKKREKKEEEEEEEEEEYVARSSERRAEMAYANALVPVTPGTGKPPLYGTVVAAAAKQAKMHEWIEPRSAIKKQQQQQKSAPRRRTRKM